MAAIPVDPAHHGDAQLLAEVERCIASGVLLLRFSPALEHVYQQATLASRRQFLTIAGAFGLFIYNIYIINDWISLPDVFVYVAVGRIAVFTPIALALLFWMRRVRTRRALETLAVISTVGSTLVPMVVMIYSDSPYRVNYQMGMLLIMVFTTVIQQVPVRYAAVSLISMLLIALTTTYVAQFSEFRVWQVNAVLFNSTAILLLMASYFLERASRLSYLFALRGRLLEVQLTAISRRDPLTQLFNRRYLGEVFASIHDTTTAAPRTVAVILLDIDHFKIYNDSYGHPQGDACLVKLSTAIEQTARLAGAQTFRYGGEELLVVMDDTDALRTRVLAEALRTAVVALAIPHPAMGKDRCVTISLGMAVGSVPAVSTETLVSSADSALYEAKHAGRDCVRAARPEAV